MKCQLLEASLPALRAHLPPLPCPQGSRNLWACEASCPGRRPGRWGEVSMPPPPGKSWSGSPQGPEVEGAPVSGWQLETVALRSWPSCLWLPGLHGDLRLCPCVVMAFVCGDCLRVWDILWGAPFEKEMPLWVQASPFASPRQIPTWRVLSVPLCVYCTALADTLLSTCFHLMEDIFL